jgi:hypothetical protein
MAKSFIHYLNKDGKQYASIYTPKRVNGKKVNDPVYLGRVINKEEGIYQSRQRGLFKFSLDTGYSQVDEQTDINYHLVEKLILNFGDVYLCHSILSNSTFNELFKGIYDKSPDSLLSLIMYKILNDDAKCHAIDWWNGTYAKIIYPKATISSQRISEHLKLLGDETIQNNFFKKYLKLIYGTDKSCGILIDSTGLPNDINFELTAVNNHNGQVSKETRLIYVIDRESKMPIFFRYNAGNIVDVTTLKNTLEELQSYEINVNYSILDAGYYSEANVEELLQNKIPFITRLIPNRKIFKDFKTRDIDDLMTAKYSILYENRLLYIKRKSFFFKKTELYAYLTIDAERHLKEFRDFLKNKEETKELSEEDIDLIYKKLGFFIIISSECIEPEEILPLYYTRQAVEQIFDVCKNGTNLLPIACHTTETFRGYIFVHFLSTILYLTIRKLFHKQKYNIIDAFSSLHYLHCKVFDNFILIKEPTKQMKDIMEIAKVKIPQKIPLQTKCI